MSLVNVTNAAEALREAGFADAAAALEKKFLSETKPDRHESGSPAHKKVKADEEKAAAHGKADGKSYLIGRNAVIRRPDGSVYHLGLKEGELFPRILTVGDPQRAERLSKLLDKDHPVRHFVSARLMTTYSGHFGGVPVSIVAIGMGAPMADFLMREAAEILPEPFAIIRLGTCGLMNPTLLPGTVVNASKGTCYVYRNYAHWDGSALAEVPGGVAAAPYIITKPVLPDQELSGLLTKCLTAEKLPRVFEGTKISGETFYATQGRSDGHFHDENDELVSMFLKLGIDACEMETHQIFHLASVRKVPCYAAGCAIGLLNRTNPDLDTSVSADDLHFAEEAAGKACLSALAQFKLDRSA